VRLDPLSRTDSLEENARPLPGGESPAQERGEDVRMPVAGSAQGRSVAPLRSAVRLCQTPDHRPEPRRYERAAALRRPLRRTGAGGAARRAGGRRRLLSGLRGRDATLAAGSLAALWRQRLLAPLVRVVERWEP